jgi:GAF domain-containing protein
MPEDNRHEQLIEQIRTLADHEDAGTALQRVSTFLRDTVDHYDWVGYYVAVPEKRLLALGPFEGAPTEHTQIPYGSGICGQAAESGDWFVVADVSSHENYLACSLETRAEVVVPVYHNGVLVGELDIDSHTKDPFSQFDDRLLAEVVEITAPLVAALVPDQSESSNTR